MSVLLWVLLQGVEDLRSPSVERREAAERALIARGVEGGEAVMALLGDDDPIVHARAWRIVRETQPIRALMQALPGGRPEIVELFHAVHEARFGPALEVFEAASPAGPLTWSVFVEDAAAHHVAVLADEPPTGTFEGRTYADAIERIGLPVARSDGALIFGSIDKPACVHLVERLLDAPTAELTWLAVDLDARIVPSAIELAADAERRIDLAIWAAAKRGMTLTPDLIDGIACRTRSGTWAQRALAAQSLASEAAAPSVRKLYAEEDPVVQYLALWIAGDVRKDAFLDPELHTLMRSKHAAIREMALDAALRPAWESRLDWAAVFHATMRVPEPKRSAFTKRFDRDDRMIEQVLRLIESGNEAERRFAWPFAVGLQDPRIEAAAMRENDPAWMARFWRHGHNWFSWETTERYWRDAPEEIARECAPRLHGAFDAKRAVALFLEGLDDPRLRRRSIAGLQYHADALEGSLNAFDAEADAIAQRLESIDNEAARAAASSLRLKARYIPEGRDSLGFGGGGGGRFGGKKNLVAKGGGSDSDPGGWQPRVAIRVPRPELDR